MSLRVAFETFGCRSNYADTVDLQAALVEKGLTPCGMDTEADVYVVNTCTVTNEADKAASKIIKKIRSDNPEARIVVTGCMAEVGEEAISELEAADAIIGPGRREQILSAIVGQEEQVLTSKSEEDPAFVSFETLQVGREKRPKRSGANFRSISLDHQLSPALQGPGSKLGDVPVRARYHLRIQEGCENSCTFCIIPQSRGRLSSRAKADIIEDIQKLADVGYNEVVLTGTHIGGYGEDFGANFLELLSLVEAKSAISRVRLSSIDPNDVSYEMVDLLSKSNTFCDHLHICIQAFDDGVLKRMNRLYRLEEVFDILNYISNKWPRCCLGSDVITGFPGETREDVEREIEVFNKLPFSYLHVFPYSERQGTAAERLDGVVPINERRRRAARWRAEAGVQIIPGEINPVQVIQKCQSDRERASHVVPET